MFKSKLAKTLLALVAVMIVAIAVPTVLGANNAQASGDYTLHGKTYQSEAAMNQAAKQWQNNRLSDTQKKLVKAANEEAAASTGLRSQNFNN